jgi:serine protease AprX
LISLQSPDSRVSTLPGSVNATYRRGSGTSMSAAVVSGLAAQLLQARPAWKPDDVKATLAKGALKVASNELHSVGAGLANGPAAIRAKVTPVRREAVASTGLGPLAGSRGTQVFGVAGEFTAQGDLLTQVFNPWAGPFYATAEWAPATWSMSQWVLVVAGNNWQGNNWQGNNWQGNNWQGNNWQGNNWQGSSWYGEADNRPYGTPIDGSGIYGSWG